MDKAEIGATHRCNGHNPPVKTDVQGPWMHYLMMSELKPSTLYHYSFGAEGYASSAVRRFRSPPAVGSAQTTRAVVLSDMGEFNWSAPTLSRLTGMVARQEYDFLVHNGDVSCESAPSTNETLWRRHRDRGSSHHDIFL